MKILIVHQFLWAHYKAAIFTQFQKLVDTTSDVEVKVIQTALYEEARIGFGEVDRSIHQYNYELLFEEIYERIPTLKRFWQTLKRVIAFKPDVINLPGYYEPAMILVQMCCRIMGIKVILSIDSTETDNANVWYREAVKRFIIRRANGFFCYGSLAADYMLKLGAKPEQILMRKNAVNNERITQIHDETNVNELKKAYVIKTDKNFIYIGRLMEIKNTVRLLEAFHQLNTAEWGLILVGEGKDKDRILKFIKDYELQNIHFIPAQPWQEVPRFMALAQVLVLPSYSEPWGLVVNEAMACGKAVIVSEKCGSAPDLVKQNTNGFTFDPFDVNQLKNSMDFFVQNPLKITAFGFESKKIIAEYRPEIVAKEMLSGFRKVCTK